MSTERKKPIVTFGRFIGMDEPCAVLADVKRHPALDEAPRVRTSRVLSVERDADGEVVVLETLNTVYVKEAA